MSTGCGARSAEWRVPNSTRNLRCSPWPPEGVTSEKNIMNDTQRFTVDALKRSHQYITINPLTPANPIAVAAAAVLGTSITSIEAFDSGRLNGNSTWLGASQERQFLRSQLRMQVGDLSRVAKSLDKTEHPDVAAQLKLGRLNSYADMIALATNAIAVVTPIKAVFTERGAPATVVEDLQETLDGLNAATERSSGGRGKRIGQSVDLQNAIREGRKQVRILDGILNYALKPTPGLLAEWKAAKRVFRKTPAEQPVETPGGGGSGSTTPPSGS